jgi:hypothetical protein
VTRGCADGLSCLPGSRPTGDAVAFDPDAQACRNLFADSTHTTPCGYEGLCSSNTQRIRTEACLDDAACASHACALLPPPEIPDGYLDVPWPGLCLEPDDLGPDDLGPEDLGPDDLGPDDLGPDDLGPDDLGPDDLGPDDLGPDDLGPNVPCGDETLVNAGCGPGLLCFISRCNPVYSLGPGDGCRAVTGSQNDDSGPPICAVGYECTGACTTK